LRPVPEIGFKIEALFRIVRVGTGLHELRSALPNARELVVRKAQGQEESLQAVLPSDIR
jgi:hypothetical protein